MVDVCYSPEYVGAAHVFETTRKAKWVADSLGRRPIDGIELVSPSSLSSEQLVQVHDPAYVRAVETGAPRSLAESQGFCWDPGLWSMVRSSNMSAPCAGRLGCILFYTPNQVGSSNTQQGTKTLLRQAFVFVWFVRASGRRGLRAFA